MILNRLVILTLLMVGLSACASVTRGTKEVLVVESTPSSAEVAMSTGDTCTTPCSIKLKRKYGLHLSITKEGYHTVEADVNAQVAGGGAAGMAGNVLIGGLIGGAIDSGNGSLNKFVPNPLSVVLSPLKEKEKAAAPVVNPGESFFFNGYVENGEKLPFDDKERKKLVKQREKEAKQKAKAEAKEAKRKRLAKNKERRAKEKALKGSSQ